MRLDAPFAPLGLALAAALSLTSSAPSWACSTYTSAFDADLNERALPALDAVAVPTNAKLFTPFPDGGQLHGGLLPFDYRVYAVGADPEAAEWTEVPEGTDHQHRLPTLEPETDYELEVVATLQHNAPDDEPRTFIRRFRTGVGPDEVAPEETPILEEVSFYANDYGPPSSCAEHDIPSDYTVTVEIRPRADTDTIGYFVNGAFAIANPRQRTTASFTTTQGGRTEVSVVAVDLAGNTGPAATAELDLRPDLLGGCAASTPAAPLAALLAVTGAFRVSLPRPRRRRRRR